MQQKVPHFVKSTLRRLKAGDVIACQLSQSKEAIDGYLYFSVADGRKLGGKAFRWMKEAGVIAASQDGLLPDCPQTYQVIGGCHADIT